MSGTKPNLTSAIFITFSGNCKKALTYYQKCFGGHLQFETFDELEARPVVSGSLVSDRMSIYGSDLVHNEGRRTGNYMAIFLRCENIDERKELIQKLAASQTLSVTDHTQKLVEITDLFEVRWVLGSQ